MRYICLLAVLFALPQTVPAQVAMRDGANSGPRPTSPAPADGASDERSRGRGSNRGSDNRQSDQHRGRQEPRPEQRPTTGLGPLGLQPAQQPTLPWWERKPLPSWEQRPLPSWEQQQVPVWQQKNPARVMLDQQRDARRLAKTPRPNYYRPPVYYVLPPYRYFETNTTLSYGVNAPYVTAPPPAEAPTSAPEPVIETGFLKLEVEPRQTLQIFIDGLYVGTLPDIGDELELRLGARRIELRAAGYRTLIFDTQIVPDRTIIYRGALDPISNAPARTIPTPSSPTPGAQAPSAPKAPDAPQAPRVIYVIAGCYMGNVSPKEVKLPAGCDINKLTTISPQ
ncbi:MAG TPA: hypothetical protein VM096_01300 [Vicinamibacterales bacterium]|nr:hypothetical protein [Vicinamibacterales bacterium]